MNTIAPWVFLRASLAVAILCAAACEPARPLDTITFEDGARAPLAVPMSPMLAFDAERGALVALDPDSLEIVATLPLEAGAAPIAVAAQRDNDRALRGAALLFANEDGESATLVSSSFDGSRFASPVPLGAFSGVVDLVGSGADGLVVFSADLGQRARFVRAGGGFTPSVPCPVPTAILSAEPTENGAEIQGIASPIEDGTGPLHVALSIEASKEGGGCVTRPAIASSPVVLGEGARAARSSALGDLLAEVLDESIVVFDEQGELARVPFVAERLEAMFVLPSDADVDSEAATLVFVTTSPSAVVLARVDALGQVSRLDSLAVATVPETRDHASRSAILAGSRLFVATESGLAVLDVDGASASLTPVESPSTRPLRAPLAMFW
ncbi:MAG: hypothetical protein U0271_06710 [Polyangiaceae bacterium]